MARGRSPCAAVGRAACPSDLTIETSTRLKICLPIHLQGLWWRAARKGVLGVRRRDCKLIESVMVTGHCPSATGVGNGFAYVGLW